MKTVRSVRKGLGIGLGIGYKNLVPLDSHIHSLSAKGVKSVSLPKYMGTWHSQGSFPTWFEKGCNKSKAKYSLRDDGKVDVENSCVQKGKRRYTKGTARSVSKDNKELKVKFFPLFEGDYIIEYLDKDYRNVIVGHPDKKYLWIMSKDEKISKAKLDELKTIAKQKGYDVNKIQTRTLNAKGTQCPNQRLDIKKPTVEVLSENEFEKRFEDDYTENEVGYATTKILPNGDVNVYLKDSGDDTRNGKLLMHELKEIEIWKKLINEKCVNPRIADEMAHNLNPVKVEGVMDIYELNAEN